MVTKYFQAEAWTATTWKFWTSTT